MGGNFFTTLFTPRMPPQVYFPTRDQCHAILSLYYTHVCTPLEAPEKTSYGDIDILVHGPQPNPPTSISELGAALNAAAAVSPRAENPEANYAIPWPTLAGPADPGDDRKRFIQVDILTLPSPTNFHYHAFTHAHSGLFTLLGPSLRLAGLILTPTSLSLRIPSIEAHRRRGSTVPLTSSPSAILDFLGLGRERYWTRFETVDGMYEYVASSRLFTTRAREVGEGEEEEKVKHRNRRNSRRPLYVRWREEFLPRALESGKYDRAVPSRDEVREEAFSTWPPARELYAAQAKAFEKERELEEVGRVIRQGVPDTEALGLPRGMKTAAIRGLRKIVIEGDESYGVVLPEGVRGEMGWDLEGAERFVGERWEEVGRVGLKRGFGRMVERREAKSGKEEERGV